MKNIFKEYFINNSNKIIVQFARYFIVGGLAFLFDFIILYLLTSVYGFHYIFSATVAFIVGIGVNYILSFYWVFSGTNKKFSNRRLIEVLIFFSIGIIGVILNDIIMYIAVEFFEINYLIAKIYSTAFIFFFNFFSRKFILYNR